jgi:hypothetical protein
VGRVGEYIFYYDLNKIARASTFALNRVFHFVPREISWVFGCRLRATKRSNPNPDQDLINKSFEFRASHERP